MFQHEDGQKTVGPFQEANWSFAEGHFINKIIQDYQGGDANVSLFWCFFALPALLALPDEARQKTR